MVNRISRFHFIISAILFFTLTAVMTFPLILKITTHIPGFFSTDESFGLLWDSWRIKYSYSHGLSLLKTYLIAYPFGIDIYSAGYFSSSWILLHHILSIFTTPVLAYNIQALLNIFLCALFVYMLVFCVTRNYYGAFFSAVIFGYCPYQFVRVWQHLGLSYNQWIPLSVLGAILLREDNSSRRNRFVFFTAILFAFSFDWTIMYFCFIALLVFFAYVIFSNTPGERGFSPRVKIEYFKKVFILGMLAFIILSPQFGRLFWYKLHSPRVLAASAHNAYLRPFEDLFTQSVRPLSFFLPAFSHPLFGKFTESFIGTSYYGESLTEHTLYLGWIPIVFAFIAFKRWRKSTRPLSTIHHPLSTIHYPLPANEAFYIGFFVLLAIAAWLLSQPPWWNLFGFKLYMPSFFMYKILPMFRAYCRFGIVVMLAVAVLAGFGLKFFLERFKSRRTRVTLAVLSCALVLFEFWNYPPYRVIDVNNIPEAYNWLKAQPDDIVITEYPFDYDSPNELYKFYQTKHKKALVNGALPMSFANQFTKSLGDVSLSDTAFKLKYLGVKYVLVHHNGYLNTGLEHKKRELEKIAHNRALKLTRSFPGIMCEGKEQEICLKDAGDIDVYEIITK